jgi:hypothetical protein
MLYLNYKFMFDFYRYESITEISIANLYK